MRPNAAYAANANIDGDGCVVASIWACIRYATADSPLGPWTHRGIVLDQVSSTTNHPAVIEHAGQWWMVYHTAGAPGGGNFRRSVAIDQLFFNPDGTMQKVVQTPEPAAVELTYPDGSTLPGTVARWERFDPALLEEPGSFPVTGVVAGSLEPARAVVHVCSSIEDGTVAGPLGASGVTCLDGASVTGPVTVREGAGLVAIGATIAGPTTAAGAGEVWLVDSALHGPLSAVGTIDQLVVSGAEIGGGAILVGNGSGEQPVVVSGSAVDGPLVCLGNRPAPTDDGVPNTVAGPTVGQS